MRAAVLAVLLVFGAVVRPSAQESRKNTWEQQYKSRTPEAMAAEFENATRPVYRYRVAIAGLMELKPGMTAADIGAGSGFLARVMASQVGPSGKVMATELDPGMVAYMNARARDEGLKNFTAIQGQPTATGLDPASVDAVAIVNAFSFFDRPREMLQSVSASLKPGGLMLIVDLPREGQGASETGMDADEVVALATAAAFSASTKTGSSPVTMRSVFGSREESRVASRESRVMSHKPLVLALAIVSVHAALPPPEETWPGFRGHEMSGVARTARIPEHWTTTEHVKWSVPIAGQGWSSPIVWTDTVFVTSAISSKPFKKPTPGLYGNEYIAELQAQGLSDEEIIRRAQARDNEVPSESAEIRYMVYALDAGTGKVKWEREAIRATPFGGRHRKNTYASETPFTDGERVYASFGQNVGLFCYSLTGDLLWKKQWEPQPIYLDFGTASSPIVSDGRVYLLQDNEGQSSISTLDAKTGKDIWRTARPSTGFPKSSWMTPFVWKNSLRTEVVTTGHGMVISYDLSGGELWRVGRMSMPTASPLASGGLLYVGTGSQGDANRPFLAIRPGASGDISLKDGATSNEFIAWSHPRASGYTPSALVHDGRAYLVHDTGILTVLDAQTGKQIYKVRVGGGGHTFSASPLAAGNRILLLTEEGLTFVLDSGSEYKEIARNDLAEMSLASAAIAGDALYIRTESKLYKIAN